MASLVAFVTCSRIPDLDDDDRLAIEPLAALGIDVEPAVWDDPSVDWNRFDLAVLRSPWDYSMRREEFVAWAGTVPRLCNDAATVAWNTDKRYLAELAAAGAAVVPTTWVEPGSLWTPPAAGQWVIKPAISAGSRNTGRYDLGIDAQRDQAVAHAARLASVGKVTMIQPYLGAIDVRGETGMIFIDGTFSHAIRKGPMLDGPDDGSGNRLYKPEQISARRPDADELALAAEILRQLPVMPLYARVDVVPDENAKPVLIELELTEPSLFLATDPGAAERLATAIATRLN